MEQGLKHQTVTAEVDYGLRWRVKATGELGQRLLLFFGIAPGLWEIMVEGRSAGEGRGLLETDPVRTIRERVSCVVRGFAGWQRWSIGHRLLVGGGE